MFFDRTRSGPYEMSRKGKHRVLPQNKELKRERERVLSIRPIVHRAPQWTWMSGVVSLAS